MENDEKAPEDVFLTLYLTLFYVAWKKGYKMYWILAELTRALYSEEDEQENFDSFKAHAVTNSFPLFIQHEYWGLGAPYVLATVNKNFSDWVFNKNPTPEKFVENVLKVRRTLMVTPEKFRVAQSTASRDLTTRKWDALDSFGGKTAGLKGSQLVYLNMGRTTGSNAGKEVKTFKR